MIWSLTGLVFLSVLFVCLAGAFLLFRTELRRKEALQRRLVEIGPPADQAQAILSSLMRDNSLSSIPLLDRLLSALPNTGRLRTLLHQAGDPCNLGTLVLMTCTLTAIGALGGMIHSNRLLILALAALGGSLPIIWLRVLRKRRLGAFDEQFPDAVDLVARALRAGHSFGSAIRMVADEMDDPVAGEFDRTFRDYSYGKSMDDALNGLVERVGLQDLKFFATAVILQRETGGNLTEILDNISHIVRERFRLLRQVKTLSAEGRLSGTILSLMAPAMLIILWLVSPGYLEMMFNHPLGETMLMAGGGFQLMGILVIRRLVTMKV